jgi:hypothetical protein
LKNNMKIEIKITKLSKTIHKIISKAQKLSLDYGPESISLLFPLTLIPKQEPLKKYLKN